MDLCSSNNWTTVTLGLPASNFSAQIRQLWGVREVMHSFKSTSDASAKNRGDLLTHEKYFLSITFTEY